MKLIQMNELKVGDIYTKEMKLKGREAFLVTAINEKSGKLTVVSRNDVLGREKNVTPVGVIYYLRNNNQ